MTNNETPASSHAAMEERLKGLQPALERVLGIADDIFDDYFELAPHPSEVAEGFPVYATSTIDGCSRELTVLIAPRKWVRIFRTADSAPDSYPRRQVWHFNPMGALNRKTNILYTHKPQRNEYPYDILVADYDRRNLCQGIVDSDYVDLAPFIDHAERSLADARRIAEAILVT